MHCQVRLVVFCFWRVGLWNVLGCACFLVRAGRRRGGEGKVDEMRSWLTIAGCCLPVVCTALCLSCRLTSLLRRVPAEVRFERMGCDFSVVGSDWLVVVEGDTNGSPPPSALWLVSWGIEMGMTSGTPTEDGEEGTRGLSGRSSCVLELVVWVWLGDLRGVGGVWSATAWLGLRRALLLEQRTRCYW